MPSFSKPKILVLEDHPATLDAIKMIFEFEGYEVMDLYHTIDLHSKIVAFKPDVILIDIILSVTDGRAICKELKLSVHAAIPILLMSSRNGIHNKNNNQCHWDDFIEKPFEMETILNKVSTLISKKAKQT